MPSSTMPESSSPDAAPSGLLMVYTGPGKGKTTAALGMVFRALGHGLRVAVVQFIKGKWKTGERHFAETLPNLPFHVMGRGFTWDSDDLSQDKRAARAAWETSLGFLQGGFDLVVLDELTYAVSYGWLEEAELVSGLRARAPSTHVVVTGRNASPALLEAADLVTEMSLVKHPFQAGRRATRGVDF